MNNNDFVKEFEKNLLRIHVNENNKKIAIKLKDLADKVKFLSNKLKNNINDPVPQTQTQRPAGHVSPIYNNTHIYFNNTLRG
tara:strand:+ start:571 stop:816 length:246 start_codon:yes stop_codon:yes gene_type:complete